MHILLITRHYPPEVSGGARRPYLLTKALREAGHRVSIVAPFVPPGEKDFIVVKHPVPHINIDQDIKKTSIPQRPTPVRNFLRQWLLWPDPEIRWVRRVVKKVAAAKIEPDWILTTSPPESIHWAGSRLQSLLKAPWLAEFRDTWIVHPHRQILAQSAVRRYFEKRLARKVLRNVTAVCCVSEYVMEEIGAYLPANTAAAIMGHFSDPPPTPMCLDDADFNLVHTGGFTLSDHRRQLAPVLDSIQKQAQKRGDIHLHLAGRLSEEEKKLCQQTHAFKITYYGELPLEKARALQAGADALLLITPHKSHALPGKYAEYCMSGRPILFQGGGDWLKLAQDNLGLLPLQTSLQSLEKHQTVSYSPLPSAENHARALLSFLEAQPGK